MWYYLKNNSTNSLSSQELEEVSSADISWDGKQFVQSKSRTTLGEYCYNGKRTEFYPDSPYGTTLKLLMADTGKIELMWCQGVFPVRTYHAPEGVTASRDLEADYGPKWRGSFAKYNHHSCSWRTAQSSLFGGLEEFSETWPRWGTMQDGECWAQEPAVDQWNASGCGLPAPTESMGKKGWGISNQKARYSKELEANAQRFGHKPHPSVLEWSMGWIPMWTRLVPLAMDKYRRWLDSHGKPCQHSPHNSTEHKEREQL